MSEFYVGQILEVIKPCGFEVGSKLPITEIYDENRIVIDGVALMDIEVVRTHFKPVNKEEKLLSELDKSLMELAQSDSAIEHAPHIRTYFNKVVEEIMKLKISAGIPLKYENKEDYLNFIFGREED